MDSRGQRSGRPTCVCVSWLSPSRLCRLIDGPGRAFPGLCEIVHIDLGNAVGRFGGEYSDGPPVADECSNRFAVIPRAENQGFVRDHPPHLGIVNSLDERRERVSGSSRRRRARNLWGRAPPLRDRPTTPATLQPGDSRETRDQWRRRPPVPRRTKQHPRITSLKAVSSPGQHTSLPAQFLDRPRQHSGQAIEPGRTGGNQDPGDNHGMARSAVARHRVQSNHRQRRRAR